MNSISRLVVETILEREREKKAIEFLYIERERVSERE